MSKAKTLKKSRRKKEKSGAKVKAKSEPVSGIEIGPSQLTRFEKARIIGTRSLQISLGAPPFIKVPQHIHDPIMVAILELRSNSLPISIRRSLPDGRHANIPLSRLTN